MIDSKESSMEAKGMKKHYILLEPSVVRYMNNLVRSRRGKTGILWNRQHIMREALAIGLAEMGKDYK